MSKSSRVDFTGQHIYIGLDVHKKSWSVCILSEDFEHKTFTQPPEVDKLVSYLGRHFVGARYHSVYEAGYSGFWIHDQLTDQGIDSIVVNPADVPTNDKERRGKRDPIDCRKLARSLRSGQLQGIYVPSRSKLQDRSLVRTRQSMVRKQTRCKNQIKSMLFFYGIHLPEETVMSHWSRRFIGWIETIQMERDSGNIALKSHLEELTHLRQIIQSVTPNSVSKSKAVPMRTHVMLLSSIPWAR